MPEDEMRKVEWKQVEERAGLAIHNLQIELEIQKAIKKEATIHLRGQ